MNRYMMIYVYRNMMRIDGGRDRERLREREKDIYI